MLRHQKPHSAQQGGITEIVSRYRAIRGHYDFGVEAKVGAVQKTNCICSPLQIFGGAFFDRFCTPKHSFSCFFFPFLWCQNQVLLVQIFMVLVQIVLLLVLFLGGEGARPGAKLSSFWCKNQGVFGAKIRVYWCKDSGAFGAKTRTFWWQKEAALMSFFAKVLQK